MRKIKLVLMFLILGFFVLIGCSTEEVTPSFTLQELASVQLNDEETPTMYVVNPDKMRNQMIVYRNEIINETAFGKTETIYDLENVTVIDDEIVIEYDGKTETFERLSSSVVQNEDRIQYEYFGPPEE